MTSSTAPDLSSQVAAIPMIPFGMLMNSPHTGFQRMCPQKRRRHREPPRTPVRREGTRFQSPCRLAVTYRNRLGLAVVLAPRSTSNRATISLWQLMARCSGVSPLLSFASISAPQSSKVLAIPT